MNVFIVIWVFMTILGISAVIALAWSIHTGQFRNPAAGAESIFDDDEPLGTITDSFPGDQ